MTICTNFQTPLTEGSTWSLKKIGPGVSEQKSFKGLAGWTTDIRTDDDRRQVITIANPEPSAQMSWKHCHFVICRMNPESGNGWQASTLVSSKLIMKMSNTFFFLVKRVWHFMPTVSVKKRWTFHANCLIRRYFTWNLNPIFLEKIIWKCRLLRLYPSCFP